MAFEVPDLPYDYNALEPHIDEQTMRVHHDKHHQAYVDKANAALEGTEWADKDVNEVLQNLSSLGDKETALRESRTKLSACDRTAKPFDEDKVTTSTAFLMPQGKPQTPGQLSTTCQHDLKRVETTWKKVLTGPW